MSEPDEAHNRGRQYLNRVLRELEKGHRREAARLFSSGCAHGIFVDDAALGAHLLEAIGKERTEQLIGGFSRRSCFYCRNGLEPCGECTGSGMGEGDTVCGTCIGLGVVRCEFCDGTGLVSIDSVPHGLRIMVVTRRATRALSRIKELLDQPLPGRTDESPSRALRQRARLLLDLNKLLGVLENTVVSSKEQRLHATKAERETLSQLAESCLAIGGDAHRRVRSIIDSMAALAQLKAKHASAGSHKRKAALAAADFYKDLSEEPTFAGTSLEHPFLYAS